jgi:hypothetical protein
LSSLRLVAHTQRNSSYSAAHRSGPLYTYCTPVAGYCRVWYIQSQDSSGSMSLEMTGPCLGAGGLSVRTQPWGNHTHARGTFAALWRSEVATTPRLSRRGRCTSARWRWVWRTPLPPRCPSLCVTPSLYVTPHVDSVCLTGRGVYLPSPPLT